jgi:CRISPR system Cascade subunit CasA
VSLKEIFTHAEEIRCLAGEMPTMDAAILRFLLAVTMTVFYRFDVNGNADEISEDNDSEPIEAISRWKEYWDQGRFTERVFIEYLEQYRERFWLFHPKTPFFQVPDLQYGTRYGLNSLRGNVKESENHTTRHHFSVAETEQISYGEATRWLIHLNAYAVNLKQDKSAPGSNNAVGTGRLGRMGLLLVDGENLFQIIMLNLTVLKDGNELWGRPRPIWEQQLRTDQGHEIAPPDNLPEAYTIQSRRATLSRENGMVEGFQAIGGDYCSLTNAFYEQMTVWQKEEDKKTKTVSYSPKSFQPSVQAWREFPTIFGEQEMGHVPGIILWLHSLQSTGCVPDNKKITLQTVGLIFGKMSYTFSDCYYDSITLASGLLESLDCVWNEIIIEEIEKCKKISDILLNSFSNDIVTLIYGESDSKKNNAKKNNIKQKQIREYLSEKYFSAIDHPFRSWLIEIDPHDSNHEASCVNWERQSYQIARKVTEEYTMTLSGKTFTVREIDKHLLSIPQIMNEFTKQLNKIYRFEI